MEILRWTMEFLWGKRNENYKNKEDPSYDLSLPPEILSMIQDKCDLRTLITLKEVSQKWFQVFDGPLFWKKVLSKVKFFPFPLEDLEADQYKKYAQQIRTNFLGNEIGRTVYQYAKQQELMETLYRKAVKAGVRYSIGDLDCEFADIELQRLMSQIRINNPLGTSRMFKHTDFKQYFGELWMDEIKMGPGNRCRDYVDYIQEKHFDEGKNVLWSRTNGQRDLFSIRFCVDEDTQCLLTIFQRYTNGEILCFGRSCKEAGILYSGNVTLTYHACLLQALKTLLIFGQAKYNSNLKGKTITLR